MLFVPMVLLMGDLASAPPTISTLIKPLQLLHDSPLLLTQQPNVLRLQELLGAKRAADGAGVARRGRHGRI